jgi:hypothetical protein
MTRILASPAARRAPASAARAAHDDRARREPDHRARGVAEDAAAALRADHDGGRLTLARHPCQRLGDRGVRVVGDRERLGVEPDAACDLRTVGRDAPGALHQRAVGLERGADVQRAGRQPDAGRGELDQLEAEAGLPDHHDERRPRGEQAGGLAKRLLGVRRAVEGDDQGTGRHGALQ